MKARQHLGWTVAWRLDTHLSAPFKKVRRVADV